MFILPVQVSPSPVYPGRQLQTKLPRVFLQLASALQPPLFVAHSSISAFITNVSDVPSQINKVKMRTNLGFLVKFGDENFILEA